MIRASVIVGLLSVLAANVHGSDEKSDNSALLGTWVSESAELAGQKLPEAAAKSITLVIEDGKYTVTVTGESTDKGTLKYDSSGKLKAMDIAGLDGPNKGKTFLAIYELNGDTLTICYELEGKERPTEFKTKEKTKLFLATYKRKKS